MFPPHVSPEHCDKPMRHKGTRMWWEGDYEYERQTWVCLDCPATVTVTLQEHAPR